MSSGILREFEPLAIRAARQAIAATVAVMDKKIQVLEGAKLTPRGIKHALHMGLIDPEMQDLLDDPDFKPLLNGHMLRRDEIGAVIKRIELRREECYSLANEEDPKTVLLIRHINSETTLLEGEVQQILDLMKEREILIIFENPGEAEVQNEAIEEYFENQQLAWQQANAVRALTHDQAKRAINFIANKARQSRSRLWQQPGAKINRKPHAGAEQIHEEQESLNLIRELQRSPEKFQELLDAGLHEDDIKRLRDESKIQMKNLQIKDCWSWIRVVVRQHLSPSIEVGETLSLILDRELTHLAHLMKEVRVLSQEDVRDESKLAVVSLPPAPEKPPVLRGLITELHDLRSYFWPPLLPRITMRKKPGNKTRKTTTSTKKKDDGKKKGRNKAAPEGKRGRKGR